MSSQAEPKLALGLAPAIRGRMLGATLIVSAVVLILVTIITAAFSVQWMFTVAIIVVLLVLIGAAVVLLGRWSVFSANTTTYRLRLVRGAGVSHGRWRDVEGLATTTQNGDHFVVLQLRDGRSTVIPVGLLAIDKEVFVDRLQELLDAANGYKRLG